MTFNIRITQAKKTLEDFTLGPVEFELKPDTITAIVGNNGSGKSTLLKLIMNLAPLDSGEIKYSNSKSIPKEYVAYLPQSFTGYDVFTGNDLKEFISQWYTNWNELFFKEIIQLFNVNLYKRFSSLSQGDQQKLMLALTLPRGTELLLLDEPTNFIDIPAKKHLVGLLTKWMETEGSTILFTSHQASDIQKLADYIVILKDGKQLGFFEKESLIESYKYFWFTDQPPIDHIPGEISRDQRSILTRESHKAIGYFNELNITPHKITGLELDDIITLILN